MTEEQTADDQINDPVFALRVLIGEAARWMRDAPFYPDASFRDFLERVSGSWGFSPDGVLDAIRLADVVVPESGDREANRAIFYRCLEIVTGRRWD